MPELSVFHFQQNPDIKTFTMPRWSNIVIRPSRLVSKPNAHLKNVYTQHTLKKKNLKKLKLCPFITLYSMTRSTLSPTAPLCSLEKGNDHFRQICLLWVWLCGSWYCFIWMKKMCLHFDIRIIKYQIKPTYWWIHALTYENQNKHGVPIRH